jgi:hypothetical protein
MPCTVYGMAKPQTKGEPITLRLPLELDRVLRERAVAEVLSVPAAAAVLLARVLTGDSLGTALHLASNTRTVAGGGSAGAVGSVGSTPTPPPVCRHRVQPIGGGLARCLSCGAMRDVHGAWKVVQ